MPPHRRRRIHRLATTAWCAALAAALAGGAAHAQPAGDGPGAAREHFVRGVQFAREERWDDAIRELQLARSLGDTPSVEFNLGVAYRAVGRARDAIAALESFLAGAGAAEPARVAQARGYLDALRAALARLRVRAEPAAATITVDGAPLSDPPSEEAVLDPGRHIVVAEASGFTSATRVVVLAPGARAELGVRLLPLARAARVRVTSNVGEAAIRVDGRLIGRGAAEEALAAGRHLVEVSAPGYGSFRRELVAMVGGDVRVRAELDDRRSVFARPAFWVVSGLVVAGLVAGGVAVYYAIEPPRFNGLFGHISDAVTARP